MGLSGLRIFLDVVAFVFGAVVGSFLNVCIYRMPAGKSIVSPPSHCGTCKTPIAWYDNLPMVSWLVLRGKCRHCRTPFSIRYMLIELFTGLLFLLVWLSFGPDMTPTGEGGMLRYRDLLPSGVVLVYWVFVGALIVATFIDLDHYIIPDEITIGGVVVGFLLSIIVPALHDKAGFPVFGALDSLLGILVGSGLVLWLAIFGEVIFKKEAMGFGDVKFMGMIGAFLGWQATLFTLVFSSFVGAVVGLIWIALSRDRRAIAAEQDPEKVYHSLDAWNVRDEMDTHAMRSSIPYGPFLALGALVWIFVGGYIRGWYAPLFQ